MRNISFFKPVPVDQSEPLESWGRTFGYLSTAASSDGSRLYASCFNNTYVISNYVLILLSIYEFNTTNLQVPVQTYTSPTYLSDSFYSRIALSPCNKYIISGSTSNGLYCWQTGITYKRDRKVHNRYAHRYDVHEAEVSCVAWCKTDPSIVF